MTAKHRIAVHLAVVFTLVASVSACVSRSLGQQTVTVPAAVPLSELSAVTLQVGDQKGGTEALLRAAGAPHNLPYKVAFSTFTSGPPQIEALTAGKIDFAITGNTPPVFGAAANSKTRVVSAWDGANLTMKVRSIGSAENGYQFGSASVRALTDPKRNSALADLLVRYDKAAQWTHNNPSEWARKYSDAVGLGLKVAALAQSRLLRLPVPLDDKVVAAEQRLADLFAAADQIPDAPDFAKWVDRRFNGVLAVSSTT